MHLTIVGMKIKQTTIQKTFEIKHKNDIYYVDYVNSDGQTIALQNRNNWEIFMEDDESLNIYSFKGDSKTRRREVDKNRALANKLIGVCIKHFNDYQPFDESEELERAEVF